MMQWILVLGGESKNLFHKNQLFLRPPLHHGYSFHSNFPVRHSGSSEELEYTLLEFLDDFSLSIPQYGTIKAQEGMEPVVILTSNNYRDLSDALKRRCNYLYIPRKTKEEIVEILKMKVQASTAIIEGVASCLYQLQELRLKQTPSISEGITWAAYLQKLMDDDDFDI